MLEPDGYLLTNSTLTLRLLSAMVVVAVSCLALPGAGYAQPNIELELFAVSDLSGTPNSSSPGTDLPFFVPGETLRITLAATNSADSAPVRVTLQIAAHTDHGLLEYDSQSLGQDNSTDSPLDNGETDYYSFDWTVPSNLEWSRYDILGSTSSPDGATVYDETAPGASTTTFGDDAWLHGFTIGEFGTTVIIHGYQLFGNIPAWPNAMAQDIRDRIVRGRIWTYSPSLGEFAVTSPYSGEAENILVLDWASESRYNYEGYSEAVAEGLFTALVSGAQKSPADWDVDNVHLIGHSRGAVVASEAAQRLLAVGGIDVHTTYLDPIWQGVNGSYDDFDVNANHPTLGTMGVAAWTEADRGDNYYSTDDNGEFIELDGSPIDGARNLDLSGRGTGIGHSDVWRWYDGTIDLDATSIDGGSIQSAWYGGANLERDQDGFSQSRLGGAPRSPMSGTTADILFSWFDDGIVNGDFERGPQGSASSTRPDPGWDIHGGGGSGIIDANQLTLQDGNASRTHNRVWADGNRAIAFSYELLTWSETTPDTLVVSVDTSGVEALSDRVILDGSTLTDTARVNIEDLANRVIVPRFELVPGGSTLVSSLRVDDVHFPLLGGWFVGYPLDLSVLLEGPYDGSSSMTTALDNAIATTQPFAGAPWFYEGSEAVDVMPFDVVDWVLVELRSGTSGATRVARKAGLLTETGYVRGTQEPGFFTVGVDAGSYWVVIHHRNHASVMSSGTVDLSLSDGSASWDFTLSQSDAYGTGSPMKDLGDGYYGLFAGDINGDGQITASDFNEWLIETKSAATGYQPGDCDLNGQVTASDFNLWLTNTKAGAKSQVPE